MAGVQWKNKKIIISGATGLIGKALVGHLLSYGAEIFVITRNEEKAKCLWGSNDRIHVIQSDITDVPLEDVGADYIIHGAACTSSKAFISEPSDVMRINFMGTLRMLELARINRVSSFVYLSTMEVYGCPSTDEKIVENHATNLDTMSARSSYPESKRACENLCSAFASQYGVPAKVVRLTQTFGPGVNYDDGRVFAEFARCVIEGRNIVLHTKGETKRCYLYTEDAVSAILTVLEKGGVSEAYNAANEYTYCSVYEMAKLAAGLSPDKKTEVIIEEADAEEIRKRGFAPTLKMNLDTSKLQSLGWKPETGLEEMFRNLMEDMKLRKNVSELR